MKPIFLIGVLALFSAKQNASAANEEYRPLKEKVNYSAKGALENVVPYLQKASEDEAGSMHVALREAMDKKLTAAGFIVDRRTSVEKGFEWNSGKDVRKGISFTLVEFYHTTSPDRFTIPGQPDWHSTFSVTTEGVASFLCQPNKECQLTEAQINSVSSKQSSYGPKGSMSSAGGDAK